MTGRNRSIAGGVAFIAAGVAFAVLGGSGPRAYLPIGLALAFIGILFILRNPSSGGGR